MNKKPNDKDISSKSFGFCEMKFAFSYCATIFHTRSVFHSEAISLAKGKLH